MNDDILRLINDLQRRIEALETGEVVGLDWDKTWTDAVHSHASNAEGGQLDWDVVWSDAMHDHSSNAEGGQLDWDVVWSDAMHDHSSNAEGGQLDWDTCWTDAVHNHTTNAEGGLLPQIVRERKAPLADDTAYNFGAPTLGNRFIFGLVANAGEYFWGVCTYNGIVAFNSSGFAVVAGGGTLAGTTGPDGSINVRDNNGSLYVENRRGSARNIGVAFIASD